MRTDSKSWTKGEEKGIWSDQERKGEVFMEVVMNSQKKRRVRLSRELSVSRLSDPFPPSFLLSSLEGGN